MLLIQRVLNWLKRRVCIHDFGAWKVTQRELVSRMHGRTLDEVQRRTCLRCGWVQQSELEKAKAA